MSSRSAGTTGQIPQQTLEGSVQSMPYESRIEAVLFQLPQAACYRPGSSDLHQMSSCTQTIAGDLYGGHSCLDVRLMPHEGLRQITEYVKQAQDRELRHVPQGKAQEYTAVQ